jgi:hypothetical protein
MRHRKLLTALIIAFAVPAAGTLVFFARPPVLIVSDAQFAALYGLQRGKRQQVLAAITLFRRVKPVLVADGAGPDIVTLALTEAAKKPLCVLFPGLYASAATRYHEEFPEIPAVLFAGNASGFPDSDDFLSVCRTDIWTDLYRAGLMAGILGKKNDAEASDEQMSVAFLPDRSVQSHDRALFTRGVNEITPDLGVVFARNSADMTNAKLVSCAVLGSAGAEYFDKNPAVPLILFTWLDPFLSPKETAVIFDDSPWALAAPAVRAALKNGGEIKIPSKPLIISGKTADNGVFRLLRKSAKKMPSNITESLGSVDKHLSKQYN